MERVVLIALFNNAALLLVLSVIYEAAYNLPPRYRRFEPYFSGMLIALICTAVMVMPFTLQSGIIFDARSIIISVTALIFGLIPTVITAAAAAIARIIIGGTGTLPGIAVITVSSLIGLAWRKWLYIRSKKWRLANIYLMSVCVHVAMLACMLLIPYPDNFTVIRAIAFPVMLVYPVATVLLGMLLIRQQAFKHAQEQLMQSEERFRLLFDRAPLGYQSLDSEGYFIDINQQWCDTLGYSREEVIGKWFGDFLSPENREAFRKRFPVFKAQGHIHSEFEVLHKSGKPIFIAFEGRIGYNLDGQFKQTHCILQDITSQKAAEAALAESERTYRNITENMSDVVWQTDLNLKTTYVSPSVQRLLGETPEEHMKRSLQEKFSAQTLNEISFMLFEEMEKESDPKADKNRSRKLVVEHFKADGTSVWVEMNISIMRDKAGRAIGLIGVSRDVSRRKAAELALEESERSKSVLLSNLPGMAYRCSLDGRRSMQFVSAGSLNLTGYSQESLIGNKALSYIDLIAPEFRETVRKEWERILSERMPVSLEYEIETASGQRKWVIDMGQVVYNESGVAEAFEGIVLDISDRKRKDTQ